MLARSSAVMTVRHDGGDAGRHRAEQRLAGIAPSSGCQWAFGVDAKERLAAKKAAPARATIVVPHATAAQAALPGGTFYLRTNTIDDVSTSDTSRPTTLSPFALDVFEVTVDRFRVFVEAGGGVDASAPAVGAGAHPSNIESGWREAFRNHLPRDRAELDDMLLAWWSTPTTSACHASTAA